MPYLDLSGATRRFDVEIRRARDEGARWGYFPVLYRAVTLTVGRAAQAGDFDDGARMERFVVDFANLYFEALDAFRAGQRTPPPWRIAFEAADRPGLMVLQHLLLGMNAHINRDLPISAAHVAPGAAIADLSRDFHHINDILESLVDEAEAAVAAHTPGLQAVDRVAGRWDELLADFSMRRARAAAWTSALALAPGAGEDPVLVSQLDSRAAGVARVLAGALPVPGARWWLEPQGGPRVVIDTLLEIGDVPAPRAPVAPPLPALCGAARPRWCDQTLDPLRQRADPDVDARVRALLAEGWPELRRDLLAGLSTGRESMLAGLPEAGGLPARVEPARLARGQTLMLRHGPQILESLLCRSLPECYAMADSAALLHRVGRYASVAHQGILDPLQLVIDVGMPGGLAPGGRGLRTAWRLRLRHAAIRVLVEQDGWEVEARGRPLNQEDLLATLTTLSALPIDSLRRLGVDLGPGEIDGWMYLWRVVGVLLGVEPRLLPRDHDDGLALMGELRRRHHRASPEGRALTAGLVGFLDDLIPGELVDGLGPAMVRTLAGDRVAELLDLPTAGWTRHLVDRFPGVGPAFLRGLLDGEGRDPAIALDLPASLREAWR